MAKFFLGVIAGIFLCVFLVVMVAVAAVALTSRPPLVSEGSTLVLDLSGDIPERNPVDVSPVLFQRPARPTVKDLHDLLEKAAADRRINAVLVRPSFLGGGWAKAQELRANLESFKKSRKPLLAWLQVATMRDYFVASAADKVYVAPEGILDVKGLRAEAMFFKNTLDKIGVQADLEHIGAYKSFSEPFTRNRMSEAYRENTNAILDAVFEQFLATVAPARQMTSDQLRAALDSGPFLPAQAVEHRLADGLLYEDQVFDQIQKLTKVKSVKKLKPEDYNRVSLESLGLAGGSRIALVYAVGDIYRGGDDLDLLGESVITSDSMAKTLRQVAEDKSLQGVIVRIDSPGGDSFASDQLWREMNLLGSKKPMVISMSDLAASGGYYIAMTQAPVLAYPGTFTGSIGVVYGKLNLKGLYDKIGVTKEILSRGRNAEIDSDYRSFTPAERQKVLESMQVTYRDFVQKVADARKKTWKEIDVLAQGRVWMGSQALDNGLVDELGGLDRAITLVKQRAKLKPEDKVTLVTYPPQKKLLDLVLERMGSVSSADHLLAEIGHRLGAATPWRSLLRGGMLKIAPYWVTVQ